MIYKAKCCTNPDMKGSFKIAQPVPDSECDCNPNETEEQAGIDKQEVIHINT